MSGVKIVRADREGALEGVRVIGLQGHLHPTETPARCAPVYVDAEGCLLRIVEPRAAAHGFDVLVETVGPPIPETGELPGHGTRVGPWPARLEHHVVVVGPSEIDRAERLKPRSVLGEPGSIERFVRWLLTGGDPSGKLACQRFEDANAAAWYCSKAESFALFERIHGLVQDELFQAARLFKADRPGARARLDEASWWLSRAATSDDDIYRAAEGLRRSGSLDWKAMLEEGLRLPNDEDWTVGLRDAARLLDDPPAPEQEPAKTGPRLAHGRAAMRQSFMTSEAEPIETKGDAAA